MLRPIAEKLLQEGIISGSLDGNLHASDAIALKAGIMSHSICDFCSVPGASHDYEVEDFDMPTAGRSTGGWAACDECKILIDKNDRKGLLNRALKNLAFSKFTNKAIEELFNSFWKAVDNKQTAEVIADALNDVVEDRMPEQYKVPPELSAKEQRIKAIIRMTGLTSEEVSLLREGKVTGAMTHKLIKWWKGFGTNTIDTRKVMDLLSHPAPPLPDLVPHWQRALDMKFKAMSSLAHILKAADEGMFHFKDSVDLKDPEAIQRVLRLSQSQSELRNLGYDEDVRLLKMAHAYSFNEETTAAIRQASSSIPHEAPLSSVDIPNRGAGWFWFKDPLPIASSPLASDRTHALLWGWSMAGTKSVKVPDKVLKRMSPEDRAFIMSLCDKGDGSSLSSLVSPSNIELIGEVLKRAGVTPTELDETTIPGPPTIPTLVFSAYVIDEKEKGELSHLREGPIPSTRWTWPLNMSFHEMIGVNSIGHRKLYEGKGPYADVPYKVGHDETMKVIAELSLFFMMACLWFKQTVPVLVKEDAHVERHARKRYVRDYKLSEPPTVQIIALRKSNRVRAEGEPTEKREGGREYHYRWTVEGHPRLQAVGPGRTERKLIWVSPHVKGPEDKPLKVKEKVYAVIR